MNKEIQEIKDIIESRVKESLSYMSWDEISKYPDYHGLIILGGEFYCYDVTDHFEIEFAGPLTKDEAIGYISVIFHINDLRKEYKLSTNRLAQLKYSYSLHDLAEKYPEDFSRYMNIPKAEPKAKACKDVLILILIIIVSVTVLSILFINIHHYMGLY